MQLAVVVLRGNDLNLAEKFLNKVFEMGKYCEAAMINKMALENIKKKNRQTSL